MSKKVTTGLLIVSSLILAIQYFIIVFCKDVSIEKIPYITFIITYLTICLNEFSSKNKSRFILAIAGSATAFFILYFIASYSFQYQDIDVSKDYPIVYVWCKRIACLCVAIASAMIAGGYGIKLIKSKTD